MILENLAPLVGTKQNSIKWNPKTAFQTCKELRIASLICLDLADDKIKDKALKVTFTNKMSIETAKIHTKVLDMDPDILDKSYIITNQDLGFPGAEINTDRSLKDSLFLFSLQGKKTDSAIFTALNKTKRRKHVLFILLDAYSLRYSLSKYATDDNFIYGELGKDRLDRLINNIEYTKYRLEEEGENVDLIHHLTTLLFNVLMLKQELNSKYIEVDKR